MAARRDFEEIGRYVAAESHSFAVAEKLLKSLNIRCERYAIRPLMGEVCPELGIDVRRFVFRNYLVFYRPFVGGIEILRVLHASRDLDSVWRESVE